MSEINGKCEAKVPLWNACFVKSLAHNPKIQTETSSVLPVSLEADTSAHLEFLLQLK